MAHLKQGDIRLNLAEAAELSACLAGLLAGHPLVPPVSARVSVPEPINTAPSIDGGGLKR